MACLWSRTAGPTAIPLSRMGQALMVVVGAVADLTVLVGFGATLVVTATLVVGVVVVFESDSQAARSVAASRRRRVW